MIGEIFLQSATSSFHTLMYIILNPTMLIHPVLSYQWLLPRQTKPTQPNKHTYKQRRSQTTHTKMRADTCATHANPPTRTRQLPQTNCNSLDRFSWSIDRTNWKFKLIGQLSESFTKYGKKLSKFVYSTELLTFWRFFFYRKNREKNRETFFYIQTTNHKTPFI